MQFAFLRGFFVFLCAFFLCCVLLMVHVVPPPPLSKSSPAVKEGGLGNSRETLLNQALGWKANHPLGLADLLTVFPGWGFFVPCLWVGGVPVGTGKTAQSVHSGLGPADQCQGRRGGGGVWGHPHPAQARPIPRFRQVGRIVPVVGGRGRAALAV